MTSGTAEVAILVDGTSIRVAARSTIAAALADADRMETRRSVKGDRRAPLCAMGVCQECRLTVDGRSNVRACMTEVSDGMVIERHLDG